MQKFIIHLANGKPFDLVEPDPSVFDIESIAFQLSKEQRFSNTIPDLYSVAQHSINVSFCLETPRLRCLGLLHDAAECVLRDIPSPVKRFIDQNSRGFLTRLEWHILTAIFEGLGKAVPFPKRLGHPHEFASMAMEMIRNGYINAQLIRLDGAIRMPPK